MPVGVGIPDHQDRPHDRGRHGLSGESSTPSWPRTLCSSALAAGATDAECTIAEGDEFSANVRMRELETSEGSRVARRGTAHPERPADRLGVHFRSVGRGHRAAGALGRSSWPRSPPKIRTRGCRTRTNWGPLPATCGCIAATWSGWRRSSRSTWRDAPKTPRCDADPRIANSEGASFDTHTGRHVFANSRGFAGRVSLQLLFVAAWSRWRAKANPWSATTGTPWRAALPAWRRPKTVGPHRRAARPAPAGRGESRDPESAGGLRAAHRAGAARQHLRRGARRCPFTATNRSWPGKLGEKVASEKLTVIDDGTIPGLFGTSPFDDEGVPTRRTVVIENGVLKSYLLNTYTARKLGHEDHRQRLARPGGQCGHRARELLSSRRASPTPEQIHRRHSRRILRDRADRLRCEYRDRRLFARRGRDCGFATASWRSRFPR